MPRKRSLTDVRDYIKHVLEVVEALERYGDCPAVREELPKLRLIGNAILRKADAKRAEGNRKDIYVPAE